MPTALHQPVPLTLTRSLAAWVTQLLATYPEFDEFDLCQLIEEKTGVALLPKDFESIRAFYLRAKPQAWLHESGDLEA